MTTPATTELFEPFSERVDRLFRELERAVKWNRPAILLAIYSSEFVREDAEAALIVRLRVIGQTVTPYRVTGDENADIPLHLVERPDRARTVFFVSGLRWGGGPDGRNAYRALNIRREYLVDQRIRAVFWLTEREAIALPSYAPDFWAFRHRVVEFVERPRVEQVSRTASDLIWGDIKDRTLRENTDAKIELREALLHDLPEGDETLAARADLWYTLASLYHTKRDHERALALFRLALEAAEQLNNVRLQSQCWNGIGIHYYYLRRNDEAITAYQHAIDLNWNYPAPYSNLGLIYDRLKRYDDAITEYQRAIDLDPQYVYPHNGLGNVYRALKRYDEAIAAYQRAIDLDPQYAELHNGLGNVYYDLKRYDDAITEYQRAIDLDPAYATAHNGLGNVHYDLERYGEAIAEYQRAIELDPQGAYLHSNLGLVYRDLKRYDEAIAEYQRAIELDPAYATAHNGLGNVYRTLKRYDEAIAAYQRAIDLDPQDAIAHNNLGLVYRDLKRYDDAIASYQRAIELDPQYTAPHNGLGNVYHYIGRSEEAIAEYQRAIDLDQQYAAPHHGLGNIYFELGRYAEAIAEYQRAAERNPTVAISLAACYRKLNREADYSAQVELVRSLIDNEDEYDRACFESVAGNGDRALELLKLALEKKQQTLAWARRDPDFDFIRDDPRFKALVGE